MSIKGNKNYKINLLLILLFIVFKFLEKIKLILEICIQIA